MLRLPRTLPWILLTAAIFLLAGVGGWWLLRWQAGVEVFSVVQSYLHDQLGWSRAQSMVVGFGAAIAAAFLLTTLALKTRVFLGVGAIGVALGIPVALLHDRVAADQCFDASTHHLLCSVWQMPDGVLAIRRDDGPQPPGSWLPLRRASREDVARYFGTPEEQAARRPKRLVIDSCNAVPAFFEAGRALIYYAKGITGEIELFDRPGSHPQTNAPLREITPSVVEQLCKGLDDIARKKAEQAEREARVQAEREATREAEARASAETESKRAEAERERDAQEAARVAEADANVEKQKEEVAAQRVRQETEASRLEEERARFEVQRLQLERDQAHAQEARSQAQRENEERIAVLRVQPNAPVLPWPVAPIYASVPGRQWQPVTAMPPTVIWRVRIR